MITFVLRAGALRRWFSPEVMEHFDPDAPEVIGIQDPRWMRADAGSPESQ